MTTKHETKRGDAHPVSRAETTRAANDARKRVSQYTWAKRDELRSHAKGVIAGAKAKLCSA